MEFIASIFSALFIGLLIAVAFTFSFALLVWVVVIAVVMIALVMLREVIRRWWFLYKHPAPPRHDPPRIIEGEYKDISDK